jgi:hypothetical protein
MADALLSELEAAMAAVDAAVERTPEAELEALETALEQAAEYGDHPKSESENGMAGCMRRKFERFLDRLGYEKYGYPQFTWYKYVLDTER